jgi:molecular chaperone GrpE
MAVAAQPRVWLPDRQPAIGNRQPEIIMTRGPGPLDDVSDAPESGEPDVTGHQSVEGGGPEVQRLQAERDELYDRLARTTADFQNARRRLEADADQRLQYANQALIKSLLPVIDSFERGLAVDPSKTDAATVLKGMQIVHDQWLAVLRQQEVEEIAPQPGEPFDPTRHEALMQVDNPEYRDQPTVVQLLQKGYTLHDRTLRPAQVAVSKTG